MLDGVAVERSIMVARTVSVVAAAYAGALVLSSAAALWIEAGTPLPQVPPPANVQTAEDAADSLIATNYSAIFERNLFGSEPEEFTAADSPAAQNLDLLLRGVAEIGGVGFAVFENEDDGTQDVFTVGDKVFDGPKLVGVRAQEAVLLRGGRRVTVVLTEEDAESTETPTPGAEAQGGIRRVDDNRYLADRREVDHSIENLSTVITQMRAVPYLRDGRSMGFRVFNIRSGSIFERMGLKNGDVIQSVNGTEITDPSRALALLEDVQTADEIRIDFLRDNTPSSFTYTVR